MKEKKSAFFYKRKNETVDSQLLSGSNRCGGDISQHRVPFGCAIVIQMRSYKARIDVHCVLECLGLESFTASKLAR